MSKNHSHYDSVLLVKTCIILFSTKCDSFISCEILHYACVIHLSMSLWQSSILQYNISGMWNSTLEYYKLAPLAQEGVF